LARKRDFDKKNGMPDYRRNRVPGGTYFFTVNLANRRSDLLIREIATLRAAVRAVRMARPFHIDAWVVLPEHMHCVWTLPEGDVDYSGRWRAIKVRFSKALPDEGRRRQDRIERDARDVWQRRFWEHTIRDERDYATHMDYVHFNPVKHGLVSHPAAWPYSSFLRCVDMGVYDSRWRISDDLAPSSDMGERADTPKPA
jgi:putative transposase